MPSVWIINTTLKVTMVVFAKCLGSYLGAGYEYSDC